MTATLTKKSGKGMSDGVISELAAYFTVKPGHEEDLRAALARFVDVLRSTDPKENLKTGLRDTRHVIFDNGRRLLWATTFETDWDPYLDDALLIIGVEHFLDWMQHTSEAEVILDWFESAGGAEAFDKNSPEFQETVKKASPGLKAIIQSVQVPAAVYFNTLAPLTMVEVLKAQRLQQAFQQVLDDPAAEQALQHPALKPLLEQAAD